MSHASIAEAFATIRATVADPDVVVDYAGYLEGRDLPPRKNRWSISRRHVRRRAAHRQPWTVPVAKEVLPAMRQRGAGTLLICNNAAFLCGRERLTGQSLYYPRVMMRTLAQVPTEEYPNMACTWRTS